MIERNTLYHIVVKPNDYRLMQSSMKNTIVGLAWFLCLMAYQQ